MLGLRWFRQDVDIRALGRDHGVSRATAYRYVDEVIEVLAAQAPDLHEALQYTQEQGMAYVILDGKVFSADRLLDDIAYEARGVVAAEDSPNHAV